MRRLEKDLDFIEECLHRENDSVRVMDIWKPIPHRNMVKAYTGPIFYRETQWHQ
jgi:hypothetical protein